MLPQVLQQAMRHEMAETFFNEPVDAVALGIPDYHEVIKVGWLQSALVEDLVHSCAYEHKCAASSTQLCLLSASIRLHMS